MKPRRDQFPNLRFLCSAYFHQDWALDDPTADAVIHRYIGDADPQEVRQVAAEIEQFLCTGMTEDQREAVLVDLGCFYYPPGEGLTYSSWLRRVYELLTTER